MPALKVPFLLDGEEATDGLFGGNILASRGDLEGPGSYAEAVDDLGVTTLRYPGGSLTEDLFDIGNPDAAEVVDNETGEVSDFIPLSDFMSYAAETGHPVTIVVPTRTQLSDTKFDDAGNRLTDIDEDELRGFVRDVVTGEYGDADVRAFEIGNEYWGAGRMNAAEYGRLASEMTDIIDDELSSIEEEHPGAAETDIIVQMGQNYYYSALDEEYEGIPNEEILADLNATYGLDMTTDEAVYSSGSMNWQFVNNQIVIGQFNDAGNLDDVDGIVAHIYSRGEDAPNSRYNDFNQIENTWLEEKPDLDLHVTEWNQKSTGGLDADEDYGLHQAHEMLNLVEGFMQVGVDEAQVWPLIQNTRNTLSEGMEHDESSPAGKMFTMMSESLPGKTMLDFQTADRESEAEFDNVDVHGFTGDNELLFYIASTDHEDVTSTDIDVSNLVQDFTSLSVRVLGVEDGENPGDTSSTPLLEDLDASEVYDDGFIEAVLAPGEIMEVRFAGVTPTEAFAPLFNSVNEPDDDPDPDTDPDEDGGDTDTGSGGGSSPGSGEDGDAGTPDGDGGAGTPGDEDGGDGGDIGGSAGEDPDDIGFPTVPVDEEEPDPGEDPTEDSDSEDGDGGDIGMAIALGLLPLLLIAGLAGG